LCSCGQGPSGPPIENAYLPISKADIPVIVNASRKFAKDHQLTFETSQGSHGFTVYMTRGSFSMAASNTVEEDIVYLTAWDKGQRKPEHIALARNYISEMESVTSRRILQKRDRHS
jgi:hypothetical protein